MERIDMRFATRLPSGRAERRRGAAIVHFPFRREERGATRAADIAMHVRFVTPLVHPVSRVEAGFFQASWYLYRGGCPEWILQEMRGQFDWFNAHLPVPKRLGRTFKRRNAIHGIRWFRPDVREAISRARYCAWLLEEGGLPVRVIEMRHHREVIWRDAHQVVAKPGADLPRAFA